MTLNNQIVNYFDSSKSRKHNYLIINHLQKVTEVKYYLSLSFFSAIENQSSSKSQRTKICTQNREHFFGRVDNGVIELSDAGRLVEQEWLITPKLRPDMNLDLGAYIVMPNHFHAILFIGQNESNSPIGPQCPVETQCIASLQQGANEFGPQSKNLGSIIRGFKSSVTKQTRITIPHFAWQARFHDHIIRDADAFLRISNYIENNPKK